MSRVQAHGCSAACETTLTANVEARKKRKVTPMVTLGIADFIGAHDSSHIFTENVGRKRTTFYLCQICEEDHAELQHREVDTNSIKKTAYP